MSGLSFPLPFKGGDQGVGERNDGSMPSVRCLAASESFGRADARTHPYPSLEREGL